MSWLAGLGEALTRAGTGASKFIVDRTERQDRLQREALETMFRDRQAWQDEQRLNAQVSRDTAAEARSRRDDDRTLAFGLADRFGGREVDDTTLEAIPQEYRSLLTERAPSRMTGDPALSGATGPVGFTPIESTIESGPDTRRFRITETDATRRAREGNASRLRAAEMRSRQFYDKLAQDGELKQLAHTLGVDRMKQAWDMHAERLGLGYESLDKAYDQMAWQQALDIYKADMRAFANEQGGNPWAALLSGGTAGAPPAPGTERITRPTPPAPAPIRPQGRRPAKSAAPATDDKDPMGLKQP